MLLYQGFREIWGNSHFKFKSDARDSIWLDSLMSPCFQSVHDLEHEASASYHTASLQIFLF